MDRPKAGSRRGDGEEHILALLDGFIASKVLMTAFRLDLFGLVAEDPLPRGAILERLDLPRRSGEILLNACLALDLLECVAGGLRTSPHVRPYLLRGPDQPFRLPTYLIEFYDAVYAQLVDLETLVRTDGRSSTFDLRPYFKDDVARISVDEARRYSAYMAETMLGIAEVVLETVDFAGARFLFDVCGGSGEFCRAVARRHPGLRAAFLDVPAVVALGRDDRALDPALDARVHAIGGDMFTTAFPPEADLVTMCRSAHDWGEEAVERVFRRIHAVLPAGGRFLIIERMLPETYLPAAKRLYLRSIYFLVKSKENEYRPPSWYEALLRRIGFLRIETLRPTRDPNRFFEGLHILVAHKGTG